MNCNFCSVALYFPVFRLEKIRKGLVLKRVLHWFFTTDNVTRTVESGSTFASLACDFGLLFESI